MTAPADIPAQLSRYRLAPAAYTAAQASISVHVMAVTVRLMRLLGIPLTPNAKQLFARRVLRDVQRARGASYQLAVANMEYSAQVARAELPAVAPITSYDGDAIVKVLDRTTTPIMKAVAAVEEKRPNPLLATPSQVQLFDRRTGSALDRLGDPNNPRVVVRVAHNTGAALARHAHQAGRDAITATADNAGTEIGWARVLGDGEACAFCAMLASRGPVYRSHASAGFLAHDHCECRAVLVFAGTPWAGEADSRKLSQLWGSATKGKSGKAALAAFRSSFSKR